MFLARREDYRAYRGMILGNGHTMPDLQSLGAFQGNCI
jgi:hypothetical protein